MKFPPTIVVLIAVTACSSDPGGRDLGATGSGGADGGAGTGGTTECVVGTESCACTTRGACDLGLMCRFSVCVDAMNVGPDASVDSGLAGAPNEDAGSNGGSTGSGGRGGSSQDASAGSGGSSMGGSAGTGSLDASFPDADAGQDSAPPSCPPGLGDCDNSGSCETDLTSDPFNCTICGIVCPAGFDSTQFPLCDNNLCKLGCEAGTEECSGNLLDGCEDILSDPLNCGSCGNQCAGNETCQNGSCTSVICGPGTANCDGDTVCETTLGTLSDCLGCGDSCSGAPNSDPVCTGTGCDIACQSGFDDCTGTPGCESDLADPITCGSCGVQCSSVGGTATCTSGTCGIICDSGKADCTSGPGCETTLGTLSDCLGCGDSCPAAPANATSVCLGSGCGFTCNATWGNCDGNDGNGCEHDINNDPLNCGACGKSCYGGTCNSGVCSQDVTPLYETTTLAPAQIALDATHVYWTDMIADTVNRVPKAGGSIEVIATGEDNPRAIEVSGGFVYWANDAVSAANQKIKRAPVTGGAASTIGSPTTVKSARFAGIDVDSTHVYWLDGDVDDEGCFCSTDQTTEVKRAPIGGGTTETIATAAGLFVSGLTLGASNVYLAAWGNWNSLWAYSDRGAITWLPKSGGVGANVTDLPLTTQPTSVINNGTYIFWNGAPSSTNGLNPDGLQRVPTGTTPNPATELYGLIANVKTPLAADSSFVYFMGNATPKKIQKVSVNGGAVTDVVIGQPVIILDIEIDSTHVYWINQRSIFKAPK